MTSKLTRGPLFAEVHNVPDDYHFTAEELDRIIAGDLFTPRQGGNHGPRTPGTPQGRHARHRPAGGER